MRAGLASCIPTEPGYCLTEHVLEHVTDVVATANFLAKHGVMYQTYSPELVSDTIVLLGYFPNMEPLYDMEGILLLHVDYFHPYPGESSDYYEDWVGIAIGAARSLSDLYTPDSFAGALLSLSYPTLKEHWETVDDVPYLMS